MHWDSDESSNPLRVIVVKTVLEVRHAPYRRPRITPPTSSGESLFIWNTLLDSSRVE